MPVTDISDGGRLPEAIIVAGPNGAGKSTFIRHFLPMAYRETFVRLDADEIERELGCEIVGAEKRSYAAGRQLLYRLQGIVDARGSFLLETTLSLRTYATKIPGWRIASYRVALIYLRLPTADASLDRVQRRVARGGHDIPADAIHRRS
jgi:predicted ABC-type ATPase